jgi:hypothetical protein
LETGVPHFHLTHLESATCTGTAGGGLIFAGSGQAAHSGKQGYQLSFWIEVDKGHSYFYAKPDRGAEVITEAVAEPLTHSTEAFS